MRRLASTDQPSQTTISVVTNPKTSAKSAEQRVEELRKQLDYHNHRYYVLDDP